MPIRGPDPTPIDTMNFAGDAWSRITCHSNSRLRFAMRKYRDLMA